MGFAAEPPYEHGTRARTAVLLVNLGSPSAPTAQAVRPYLAQFLSDPRVVEIPRPLWWLILHGVILRTRPAKSAAKYRQIWLPEGSPLAVWTERLSKLLLGSLGERGHDLIVRHAMRYGQPSIAGTLDELKAQGVTRVLVLPLYPQYAAATTASVSDAAMSWAHSQRRVPEMRFVAEYHDDARYIEALAQRVLAHWQANGRAARLVLSFHGLPQRSLTLGDPYHCQCHKTARLLRERLGLEADRVLVTFQSRFGKARWLQPYTEASLQQLASSGVTSVDVMCPGFVADCLETLEEINIEARAAFMAAGGREFNYIACLNDSLEWTRALVGIAEQHLQGWDTRSKVEAAALHRQRDAARALGAAQ